MTLSGTIDDLALPDVIRLIAKSERTGVLRVSDGAIDGQVYFEEGELTYATSRSQDSFIRDLVRLGLLDEEDRSRVERRKANIEDVLRAETGKEALREFLEEQITEVLVRLMRLGSGVFEFMDGVPSRYVTGIRFPIELPLEEAETRLARWKDIEEVIPSPHHRMRMIPSLDDEKPSVEIDAMSWNVLAALNGGSSLSQITSRLGMWEYPAAKNLARLIREGLVEVGETVDPQAPPANAWGEEEETEQEELYEEPPETEPEAVELAGEAEAEEPDQEKAAEEESEEEPEEEEVSSELMKRWKQLRSRDTG